MKKILLFLMFAMFCIPWAANAQTTVTIGDLETATNDTYLPMNSLYEYSYSQQIYTADEIGTAGTITAITIWMYGAEDLYEIPFDIYMVETDKESFTSTSDWAAVTSGDIVYSGSVTVHNTEAQAYTFTLTSPFTYSGTGNLLIAFDNNCGQWKGGLNGKVFAATDGVNRSIYARRDSQDYDPTNMSSISANGLLATRNVIEIDITPASGPTCERPDNFEVSNITGYGADFSWTGTVGNYTFEYKKASEADWTVVTGLTATNYTLSNLETMTAYNARVKAVCGTDFESSYKTANFTTLEVCPDGYVCIGEGTTTSTYLPTYNYYNYSLTEQIYTAEEIGQAGAILSVDIYSVGTVTRDLEFYMVSTEKETFTGGTDWIAATENDLVYSGSVTFAANSWNTISFDNPFIYNGNSNVALIVRDMTGSYVSGINFYVFDATSQAIYKYQDAGAFGLDGTYNGTVQTGTVANVKNRVRLNIGEPPTCPNPRGLAASNVTNHTADLTWTAGGEETAWTVEYATDEAFTVATSMDVNDPTATLTGLAAETGYFVRVKANCGVGDESDWTSPVSFTTQVACATPTNLTMSDVEPFSATLSWNGTASSYNLRYRVARGFHYDFETATPWVEDNFAPCTTYDGDGLHTYQITDWTPLGEYQFYGSMMTLQSGVTSFASAHGGELFGGFVAGIPDGDVEHNDDYFILPSLTIEDGYVFEFWASSLLDNWGLERMRVGVYGGNGTITDYLAGSATEYVEVPNGWTKYSYDLSGFAGQTIQLAINSLCPDAYILGIDDIFVGDPNDDTWDETLNNVTSPYALTGLTDETMYEVQVQAACGGTDGVSEWVGTSFTTPSNCAAPASLEAADITPHAATLSWTGYQDSYNVQYRTAESRETYYFNDFNDKSIEGWTYGGLWIYGFTDPIYNVAGDDNYFLAMGWNSTEEENIISCELPAYESGAHVEFYYFGYTTANTFQVGFSTTTNDADAFTWSDPIEAPLSTYTLYNEVLADGVKYVAWKATAASQDSCIFIDDFGIFGETIPAGAWQTANGVTSPQTIVLAGNTEYEWQVQGVNPACDGGVTEWSPIATFTTPDACQVPVIDSVSNIEATTATVYWTGVHESYNVRYAAFETESIVDFDDEEIPAAWTNDETNAWALTDTLTDGGFCLKSTIEGQASTSSSISFTATYESAGVISFDAMFMGEGSGSVYDKCIFSIDGDQYFSYGAIGQAWYDMTFYFAAGEHTFTWTYSKDSSVDPTGDFFAIDNVKIQLQGDTWTTVENVEGGSYDMTGLTPESVISVQVQGNNTECDGGVTEWSDENLFITPEQGPQVIALVNGTNWVSFNVEITVNDLKAALIEAAPTAQIQIVGQNSQTTYNPNNHRWTGNLTFNLASMYKIKVNSDCEITLQGAPVDPADHPYAINQANNWIAFPLNQDMTLADAFAGFAVQGDQLNSQTGGSVYARRWQGSVSTLQPGKGYVYKAASGSRTLVFPSSAK